MEMVVCEQKQIETLSDHIAMMRNVTGSTNPQFAHDILIKRRAIKRLMRSYGKIVEQINKVKNEY